MKEYILGTLTKLKTWKRGENNHIFNQVCCELSTENEDMEETVGYCSELKEEIRDRNISLRPISMEMVMDRLNHIRRMQIREKGSG